MSKRDIGQEILEGIQEIKAYKAAAGDPRPTAGQGPVVEQASAASLAYVRAASVMVYSAAAVSRRRRNSASGTPPVTRTR